MQETKPKKGLQGTTRKITVTAMLSAVAAVLMMLEFPVPLMPGFIKMDISELPALLASFSLGPIYGVAVCLVKNLIKLFTTNTGGVGELANFTIGLFFVLPAGLIYKFRKTRGGAVAACLIGALVMAAASLPINYFITYPVYTKFMPIDAIIGAYQAIRPGVNGLLECLITFNMPFTFVKGLIDAILCFLIYKPLSPILHGRKRA